MHNADKSNFGRLHRRYVVALVLVGLIGLGGLAVERSGSENVRDHVHLVTVAGKQRMLSQRAALLSLSVHGAEDGVQYGETIATLRGVRKEFVDNHEFLLNQREAHPERWSDALEDAWFQNPGGLDGAFLSYVAQIDRVIETPFEERWELTDNVPLYSSRMDAAPNQILEKLDDVVTLYADEHAAQIILLNRIYSGVFAVNLGALILLSLFVFRPLIRSLQLEHRSLKEMYRRLLNEMSERYQVDRERAAAELKFRNAFENAPIGIGLLRKNGMLFDANPSLRRMFGRGASDTELSVRTVFHDSDRKRFDDLLQDVSTHMDVRTRQLRCFDDKGKELHVSVSLSPVREKRNTADYFVIQVQDVTESHSLNTKLKWQASYDDLTGLMNRRAFNQAIEEEWEFNQSAGHESYLLMMDLDQFKVINDTSGHAAGDQLLRRVSEVIRNCVRSDDRVCRLGGDEFGVLLPNCPAENAERVAETIRSSIEDLRFVWGPETYRIGVSIGVVPVKPELGDVSEIQQLCDAACYAAKEAGRNCIRMASEGKSEARLHRRQIRWVQRIRDAMDNRRFVFYCQSIVPTQPVDRQPDRVEVLLRLRDPEEKRLVPPGAFLPAVERYGLNVELDEWVVSNLIRTLVAHGEFGATASRYWINLSGNSVGDERFATWLINCIQKSPLPKGTINFEVTETAVIRNLASAGRLIGELRDMGCQIALDDFGSGLSSFGYLKHLSVDQIKIDGMFIKDIHRDDSHQIFVKSIIDIAHTMDIKTVAEYVEDQKTADIVTELGVDYMQGFQFGEPQLLVPEFRKAANDDSTLWER